MSKELYDIAEYTLKRLKEKGINDAELWVNRSRMDELNLDAGKFSLMRTTFSTSLYIRALSESRKGTYNTNKIDRGTADAAIDAVTR